MVISLREANRLLLCLAAAAVLQPVSTVIAADDESYPVVHSHIPPRSNSGQRKPKNRGRDSARKARWHLWAQLCAIRSRATRTTTSVWIALFSYGTRRLTKTSLGRTDYRCRCRRGPFRSRWRVQRLEKATAGNLRRGCGAQGPLCLSTTYTRLVG